MKSVNTNENKWMTSMLLTNRFNWTNNQLVSERTFTLIKPQVIKLMRGLNKCFVLDTTIIRPNDHTPYDVKRKDFVGKTEHKMKAQNFMTAKMNYWISIPSVIRQKVESRNGCFKKTNHVKFSEKRTFRTPWYAHVRISG